MDKMEEYGFFAMIDRMQYIGRWALMRNSRTENIKEHSFDVAVIAHCLTILHNKFEKDNEGAILPDPYKVQAYALYHDCTEIITGDLPTPIKYCGSCPPSSTACRGGKPCSACRAHGSR